MNILRLKNNGGERVWSFKNTKESISFPARIPPSSFALKAEMQMKLWKYLRILECM
jgi:hypothetical protein